MTERIEAAGEPTVAGTAAKVLSGQLAIYLVGFVTSVLIARAVGATGRGEYYLPVLAATFAVTVVHLGVESSSAVAFSERGVSLSRIAQLSGALALIIGPIGLLLLLASYFLLHDSVFAGVPLSSILIVSVSVPLGLHQLWLSNVYLLARRLGVAQVALVAGAVAQLAATIVVYALGWLDVTTVLVLYVASLTLSWLIMLGRARRFTSLRPRLDAELARSVVAFGVKFHIGLLLAWLVLRFDVFLVSYYLGTTAVGVYSVAVVFAELGWLVTNPLQQAAFSFQAQMPLGESVPLAFKAARFNFAIAFAVSAGFAATLWLVIPVLYGDAFTRAYPALLLLMPGVTAMAACRPLTLVLARAMMPWLYTATGALAFAINGALNAVLLPRIGILGASVASTVAYVILTVVCAIWTARVGHLKLRQAVSFGSGDVESLRVAARALSGAVRGRGRSCRSSASDPSGPGALPRR